MVISASQLRIKQYKFNNYPYYVSYIKPRDKFVKIKHLF